MSEVHGFHLQHALFHARTRRPSLVPRLQLDPSLAEASSVLDPASTTASSSDSVPQASGSPSLAIPSLQDRARKNTVFGVTLPDWIDLENKGIRLRDDLYLKPGFDHGPKLELEWKF